MISSNNNNNNNNNNKTGINVSLNEFLSGNWAHQYDMYQRLFEHLSNNQSNIRYFFFINESKTEVVSLS